MAFKIQSIANMEAIANTMSNCANEATAESQKIVVAVDELTAIISGKGVGETLQKLRNSVTSNTQSAVQLLNDISLFIRTQVTSYSQNEDETTSALSSVQSTLDGINID